MFRTKFQNKTKQTFLLPLKMISFKKLKFYFAKEFANLKLAILFANLKFAIFLANLKFAKLVAGLKFAKIVCAKFLETYSN